MKIAIIDNYDSFTFNIKHYVEQFSNQCDVINIDKVNIKELKKYDKLIFSPGPGIPKEKPILWDILKTYQNSKPILGICFGHQSIAEYFGATLFNMEEVHHGVSRETCIKEAHTLWKNIPKNFNTGRYHSWAVKKDSLPDCLRITAIDSKNGTIMALKHKVLNINGLQFHPESILSEHGLTIIKNWIINT